MAKKKARKGSDLEFRKKKIRETELKNAAREMNRMQQLAIMEQVFKVD